MVLADEHCVACQTGAAEVDASTRQALLAQLPAWQLVRDGETDKLQRVFEFPNFVAALDFTNQVGALAEQYNHHPALLTEWGRVTVRWWTHKIGGLHRNDFVLAAKTDQLLL
jgi:4a-hydroxytetrahydrobiopterin dehydratase